MNRNLRSAIIDAALLAVNVGAGIWGDHPAFNWFAAGIMTAILCRSATDYGLDRRAARRERRVRIERIAEHRIAAAYHETMERENG